MVARIKLTRLDGSSITAGHAWRRSAVDLALWAGQAASTAYVLATWSDPEWAMLTKLDRLRLLYEHDRLRPVIRVVGHVWIWSELIVLLLNDQRRALHDFIARTVVIRIPQRTARDIPA